jgi:hypothetical protein
MKAGQQMRSVVCSGKVIVLRAPKDQGAVLSCGGQPMVDAASDVPQQTSPTDSTLLGGSLMGKRYSDPESGIQLLCVTSGEGSLAIDGQLLQIEAPKQLPSSD